MLWKNIKLKVIKIIAKITRFETRNQNYVASTIREHEKLKLEAFSTYWVMQTLKKTFWWLDCWEISTWSKICLRQYINLKHEDWRELCRSKLFKITLREVSLSKSNWNNFNYVIQSKLTINNNSAFILLCCIYLSFLKFMKKLRKYQFIRHVLFLAYLFIIFIHLFKNQIRVMQKRSWICCNNKSKNVTLII